VAASAGCETPAARATVRPPPATTGEARRGWYTDPILMCILVHHGGNDMKRILYALDAAIPASLAEQNTTG
jgi:hypothetical protein